MKQHRLLQICWSKTEKHGKRRGVHTWTETWTFVSVRVIRTKTARLVQGAVISTPTPRPNAFIAFCLVYRPVHLKHGTQYLFHTVCWLWHDHWNWSTELAFRCEFTCRWRIRNQISVAWKAIDHAGKVVRSWVWISGGTIVKYGGDFNVGSIAEESWIHGYVEFRTKEFIEGRHL